MRTEGPLHGASIVCVGFADWQTENWLNQHHLMSRLSRNNTVLFIESLGLRRPTISTRDLKRIGRRLKRGFRPLRRVDEVNVLSPLIIPYHGNRVIDALNRALLRRTARKATQRLGIERPILWSYVPQALTLVDALQPSRIVYHCVDDIAAVSRDAEGTRSAEARMIARADLVIASSETLAASLRSRGATVKLMPNVADTTLFAQALEPGPIDQALASLPRPRIVFVGAVSSVKVDFELIIGLARLRPHWSVVLVGPVGLGDPSTDVSALKTIPNVHLVGHRRHGELPDVLRGADAALIPYRLNEVTASVFPMKVYEYLAAGLPIVSTPLPSLAGADGVTFAANAPDTASAIDGLLARANETARLARSELARDHSWENRIDEIERALSALP